MQNNRIKKMVDKNSATCSGDAKNHTMSGEDDFPFIDTNQFDLLENANSEAQTKNKSALNTDCMGVIFENLCLIDLVNVADSSKGFYDAACQVYKRKYSNINVMFYDQRSSYFPHLKPVRSAMENNSKERIPKPIILLKLLRNFGHLIKYLVINLWYLNDKLCIEIEHYLEKYCSDSLQRFIVMCGKSKIIFENLQKPFKKVTALSIVAAANHTQENFRFLNEINLPNLQHIYLHDRSNALTESETIHFKTIEYFTYFGGSPIRKYPFSFERLQHITFSGCIDLNDAFYKCISNIKHLQTLKIHSYRMITDLCTTESFSKIFELENIVTNVVEMEMEYHPNLTPELVYRFLKQCQKLRKLSFHIELPAQNFMKYFTHLSQTPLPSNLNDKWKCYTIDPYENPELFYNLQFYVYKCFVLERISS